MTHSQNEHSEFILTERIAQVQLMLVSSPVVRVKSDKRLWMVVGLPNVWNQYQYRFWCLIRYPNASGSRFIVTFFSVLFDFVILLRLMAIVQYKIYQFVRNSYSISLYPLTLGFIRDSLFVIHPHVAIPRATTLFWVDCPIARSLKASPTYFITPVWVPPEVIQASKTTTNNFRDTI